MPDLNNHKNLRASRNERFQVSMRGVLDTLESPFYRDSEKVNAIYTIVRTYTDKVHWNIYHGHIVPEGREDDVKRSKEENLLFFKDFLENEVLSRESHLSMKNPETEVINILQLRSSIELINFLSKARTEKQKNENFFGHVQIAYLRVNEYLSYLLSHILSYRVSLRAESNGYLDLEVFTKEYLENVGRNGDFDDFVKTCPAQAYELMTFFCTLGMEFLLLYTYLVKNLASFDIKIEG